MLRDNIELKDLTLQDIEVSDIKYVDIDKFYSEVSNDSSKILKHKYLNNQFKKIIR